MSSALKDKIIADMKDAMRAKEKLRLECIRMITAAIKQKEVDERIELTDDHVLAILEKLKKQRLDAAEQFEKAGRQELADKEKVEMAIIQTYLPEPLPEAEIDALIKASLTEVGASSIKDMGKVMNTLRPKIQGRADMKAVSAKIKAALS